VKNSTSKRSGGASFKLKPTMVVAGQATAGALLALSAAGNVYAQAAAAPAAAASSPETQQVVVTGIRKGIEDAISVKKNNDSIVEAISAEDIGKLPDTSVAESLARLPGLTAQQVQGRAQQINVRGMPAEYANGLLNGREQTTTNDSRTSEFDQYPAELLGGAVVYKTTDAGLIDQGLAATIDLQTVRPLNFAQRQVAGNYRRELLGKGTTGEGDGKKFSLSYIDQFADRKVGIALGFARLDDTTGVTERFESWGGGQTTYQGNKVNVPFNGYNLWHDQTKRKRDGAVGVLEFKPNKNFHSTVDVFFSKFDFDTTTKGFQAPLNDSWQGGPYDFAGHLTSATLLPPADPTKSCVTDAAGCATAISGTWDNVRAVIRNDETTTKDKSLSFGWKNELALDGGWTLVGDISHSNTKRDQVILETYAGTTGTAAGPNLMGSINYDGSNGGHQFSSADIDYTDRSIIKLTDNQGWGGAVPQAGYVKRPHIADNLNAIRLDAKKDLGGKFFSDLTIGANFTNRSKKREYDEHQLVIGDGSDRYASIDIPGTGTTDLGGIEVPTYSAASMYETLFTLVPKIHQDIYNKDWTVHEKTTTGYLKAGIDADLNGVAMGGNIGAQLVHVDQNSSAYNVQVSDLAGAAPVALGKTSNDFLPSLNLHWDLGTGNVVRLGVARQMARPNMNDMRASATIDYQSNPSPEVSPIPYYTKNGGNPYLNPYRANSVDLSYEHYFGTKAYVGAAIFYKKLLSYVTPTAYLCDLTGQVTAPQPADLTHSVCSGPLNGKGGDIEGSELTVSLPFNMAFSWLDGFGTQVTYSYTGSSVNPPNGAGGNYATMPMQGLSRDVASYTLYYEKYGFSARWNRHTRSDYVGSITNNFGDAGLTWIKGVPVVDYQLGYEFEGGPLKGLGFQFQVDNANNAPYVEFQPLIDGSKNISK
jgi:iron complex outermembrane receptor protein